MKKFALICLAAGLLLSACSSPTSTPYELEPVPTPQVEYQIVGSTKNTYMVVVEPESSMDRAGLEAISRYLCPNFGARCMVWFWDDINKADTSFPLDTDKEKALIAYYYTDPAAYNGTLLVYALGDQ